MRYMIRAVLWFRSKPVAAAALFFVLDSLICWMRVRPIERGRLYAEDSAVFLAGWFSGHGPLAIFQPYEGYLQFIPRIASGFVALTPVYYWGLATTAAACIVVGAIGSVSFYSARSLVTSYPALVAIALVPALLPLAAVEPLGTLCNLHWWALYGIFWIIFTRPTTRRTAAVLVVYTLFLGLSEIQIAFFAPLAFWSIVRSKNRAQRLVNAALIVSCAAQGVAFLFSSHAIYSTDPQDFHQVVRGFFLNAFGGTVTSSQSFLQSLAMLFGYYGLALLAAISLVPVLIALARAANRERLAMVYSGVTGVILWFFAVYVGRNSGGPPVYLIRWGMGAAFCLLIVWIVALDQLILARRLDNVLAWFVVAALLIIQSFSFTTKNDFRIDGPEWTDFVASARAECATGADAVTAAVIPSGWVPVGSAPANSGEVIWEVPCQRLR